MTYKKYPSLTRDDSAKNIKWWLDRYPELENKTYQITEKLDGANVQFNFAPDTEFTAGKRSSLVDRGTSFMGLWETINGKYQNELEVIQIYADDEDVNIRIYGELYGQGIQNRVYYGDEKYIAFFDVMIDDKWLSPDETENFFNNILEIDWMYVPVIGTVDGIFKALQVKHDFMSYASDTKSNGKPNYTEGVVIKPYYHVYEADSGSMFYIKRKNELFGEKTKTDKPQREVSSDVLSLTYEFKTYINENRVLSVFSKEGEIEKANQMGVYIRLVLDDAKLDFIDDNPDIDFDGIDKKDMKMIFNVGKDIVQILRKYL